MKPPLDDGNDCSFELNTYKARYMKTIIVATDFSPVADNAVEYAASAARQIGAKLVLFHLHTVSIHAVNARVSPLALQEMLDRNKERFEERGEAVRQAYGIEVVVDWYIGDFYESIRASVASFGADLVVMGMAAKSLEQDLLGNTTTAAIHKLRTPILAIPQGAKFKDVKQVLFACDMLYGAQRVVLEQVRKVAAGFGAQVGVFHVNRKITEIKESETALTPHEDTFDEMFDGLSYYFKEVRSQAVLEEIKKEIKATRADMLIMVPLRYGFWSSLIHKSKTRIMASQSEIPLLSIPLGDTAG